MQTQYYTISVPSTILPVEYRARTTSRRRYHARHARRNDLLKLRILILLTSIAMLGLIFVGAKSIVNQISMLMESEEVSNVTKLSQPVEVSDVSEGVEEIQKVETPMAVEEPVELPTVDLVSYSLPDVYYPGIDFSYFQPYMDYRCITDPSAPAYQLVNDQNMYVDEYGFCRFAVSDDQFSINGKDDYVIALGTYYKDKGLIGNRYLIETATGSYTAITGDEKSDLHTDPHGMFVLHGEDNQWAGMIEFLVDADQIDSDIKAAGTVTVGDNSIFKGEIISISEIVE